MAATGKRYKAEQIVNILREIDVKTANGKSIPEARKLSQRVVLNLPQFKVQYL